MTVRVEDLLAMSRRELMETLEDGHPIDPETLDDTEYLGVSLGLPRWVEKLTWKKFKKTFHRDPDTGALRGWNVRLEQNALDAECIPKEKKGRPVTFGHYEVIEPNGEPIPAGGQGLLIHYGRGGNRRLDPLNRMRDPLVALSTDGPELLLGWTYVDLGFARIGTPSFFALVRDRPLTEPVKPPAAR